MESNEVIRVQNHYEELLSDIKEKIDEVTKQVNRNIDNLKPHPEEKIERGFFHCDGCKKGLLDEKFIVFNVWKNFREYRNQIIGEQFRVYCVNCWNKEGRKK